MSDYNYEQVLSDTGIHEMVRQCMLKEKFHAAIYINDEEDRVRVYKKILSMSQCKGYFSQFQMKIEFDNDSVIYISPAVESMRFRRSCMIMFGEDVNEHIKENVIRKTLIDYHCFLPETPIG